MVEVEPNDKLLFSGYDGLNLDFKRAKLEFPDPEALGEFINDISAWSINSTAFLQPPTLQIEGKGDVFCVGIPVRNVDFYREQSVEIAKFGMYQFAYVFGSGPSIFVQMFQSTLNGLKESPRNLLERRYYLEDEFLVNGAEGFSPALSGSLLDLGIGIIDSASLKIDSTGVNLNADGQILGNQPVQVKFGLIEMDMAINGARLATVTIRGINVRKGYPRFDFVVNSSPVLEPKDSDEISAIVAQFLSGNLDGLNLLCVRLRVTGPTDSFVPWLSNVFDSVNVYSVFLTSPRPTYHCRFSRNNL